MNQLQIIWQNSWFRLTLVWIFIQQVLVATGTFLMGDLAANFDINDPPIASIFILILSLTFSGSLFHYLQKRDLKKAERSILWGYLQKYSQVNYSRSSIWRNLKAREERHDVMIREGQDSITSTIYFSADTVATTLNIILNSISVILVTSPILGGSIFLSGVVGLWIVHRADKSIATAAANEMSAQNAVNAHLANSWDNIILGNRRIYNRWMFKLKELFDVSTGKAIDSVRANDATVAIAGFVTNLIVIFTVLILAYKAGNEIQKIIALLVMLPRSMQIVMHIQVIQSYWAHWKFLLQKIECTEKTCVPASRFSLSDYINYQDINITPSASEDELKMAKNGRFTIYGKNGAGKSSFLLSLKDSLGDDAIYIPAQHSLYLGVDRLSLSSGQQAISAIEEALNESVRFIILDEWDANLSQENKSSLDRVIDKLSNDKVVIEVRHHQRAL